ncbi:MAG: hypothetical protein A2Z02_05505 [Chloroflexi bacterium RBG_16_48_7]|nr:MAG: hypothetical protein A2Z02_05505 [Chloroflexi bacterium RBG_16_48_7]
MFDKILVVMGLLSRTWSAIPYVRHLARGFGSEIYFLGVSTESQPVWDQSLLGYIEGISRSLEEENIIVKTDFIHGNPAVEVVKYSKKNNISLIVTTAGTTNEITCSILSNISRRMGMELSIPILTVPPRISKDFDVLGKVNILNLLVPLDRSPMSETALPYIESIANQLNCSVTLLNVNTPPVRGVPVLNTEVRRISNATGKNYLKRISEQIHEKKISADYQVIDGNAVKTILNHAKAGKFDMIVMATRGATGIEGWAKSSVTKKVSEKAEIPVLAVCNPHSGISQ